jgi:hypothetical protein
MPTLTSLGGRRSVTAFGAACALTALVAACSSSARAPGAPASPRTAAALSSIPAPPSSAAPSASAPAAPASATAKCASAPVAPGGGAPTGGSITVCPDAAPVGGVVQVTITGCAPTGPGLPNVPAAGLFFLGPGSWLGTNGGGGAFVNYAPETGNQATATFTIPATYTGGNQNGPYPTVATKPGSGYEFVTDPAGECNVHFTVLPG